MTTELSLLHRRGDSFELEFDLSEGWVDSHFTGGVVFTLRDGEPGSSVVSDDDALAQVSVAGGGIVFTTTTHGVITIPGDDTKTWPAKRLRWDVEARITTGAKVHTIASGTLRILADITRGAN